MSTEENKALLRAFVRDVLDGKNLDAADRYLSPSFLYHDRAPGELPRQQTGLNGTKSFLKDVVFPAFSEFNTQFDEFLAEDDLVAARWRQSSHHTGAWQGFPPTGKTIGIAGASIVRVRDGLIIEEWEARDGLTLLRELGVSVPRLKLQPLDRASIPVRPTTRQPSPFLTNGPLGRPTSRSEAKTRTAVVGEYFMEAINRGRLEAVGDLFAPTYVLHDPTGLQDGDVVGIGRFVKSLRTGMPDVAASADLMFSEGDRVVSRWTARGTHTGELFGIAPTGRKVAVSGISVSRVDSGQVQEEWSLWDQLSVLQQTGAVQF